MKQKRVFPMILALFLLAVLLAVTVPQDALAAETESRASGGTITVVSEPEWTFTSNPLYYNYYSVDTSALPLPWTLNKGQYYVTNFSYFSLSNGQVGYCIQPFKSGATGTFSPASWGEYSTYAQQGVALALIYGAPNNGDTSSDAYLATAALVRDFAMGYRNEKGYLGYYKDADTGEIISSSPFGDRLQSSYPVAYQLYTEYAAAIQKHGTLPSFASSSASGGSAYKLTQDSSGNYTLTLTDTNNVLKYFHFTSSVSGLSFSVSGNKLTITATPAAAAQISSGLTVSAEVSYNTASLSSAVAVWQKSADSQKIAVINAATSPVPAYFHLEVEQPKMTVTLEKSIDASDTCIAQIQGNPLYSLAGAQYEISVNGSVVETLTTGADGKATSSQTYDIGTVIRVKETVAPEGFKLDTKTYTFTVTSGDNTFSVKDQPLFDPPFAITKVDKDTTTAQGNGSFQGAVFRWEYYPNYDWSGEPLRTWYFQTDERGRAEYDTTYLAVGYDSSDLYYGVSGRCQIPLGSIKITEIKNSLGYTVLPQAIRCTIIEDAASPYGASFVWDDASATIIKDFTNGDFGIEEPIDESLFGSLTVEKTDTALGTTAQGSCTLAGATFEVVNNSANSVKIEGFPEAQPGEVCCTFVTDENGRFTSGSIFPLGSYTVREAAAPTGYTLNENWSQTFTVTTESRDFAFTASNGSACPDSAILGGLRIIKQDDCLGEDTGADALLDGITFSVINSSANPVVVDGKTFQPGETVLSLKIAWDGEVWTAESGAVLPYGDYIVREDPIQPGSNMANAYYQLNTTAHAVEIREEGTTVEISYTDHLVLGTLELTKTDIADGKPLPDARYRVYDEAGTVVAEGRTDEKGKVTFSGLRAGKYSYQEFDAPEGYLLDTTAYTFEIKADGEIIKAAATNTPEPEGPKTGDTTPLTVLLINLILSAGALGWGYWSYRKRKFISL